MAQPYVGEIRMFAGTFAPAGWMLCNGDTLQISENETLFQLIGTTYGGDGESTFNLPNLQSRVPVHMGTGLGVSYTLAEMGGVEAVTLSTQQIPSHTHNLIASADPANTLNADDNVIGTPLTATPFFADTPNVNMAGQSITPEGGSQPHDNMHPFLGINYIISLFGIFPQPS